MSPGLHIEHNGIRHTLCPLAAAKLFRAVEWTLMSPGEYIQHELLAAPDFDPAKGSPVELSDESVRNLEDLAALYSEDLGRKVLPSQVLNYAVLRDHDRSMREALAA